MRKNIGHERGLPGGSIRRALRVLLVLANSALAQSPVGPDAGLAYDMAFKTEFMLSLSAAYERANPSSRHYLAHAAGAAAIEEVLRSRIGTKYDEYYFVGFEYKLVSRVEKVEPAEGELPVVVTLSGALGTTSEEYAVKLMPDQPWLNIAALDRTNPFETEIYDMPVYAYVRAHPVQFNLGETHYRTWINRNSGDPADYNWIEEYDPDLTDWERPFPQSYSREVAHAHANGESKRTLDYEIIADGFGIHFTTTSYASKEEELIHRPFVEPHRITYRVNNSLYVKFMIKVYNPDENEVSVEFDFRQRLEESPGVEPPAGWDPREPELSVTNYQQWIDNPEMDLFDLDGVEIYHRYDRGGVETIRSNQKIIGLMVSWDPASIDLHSSPEGTLEFDGNGEAELTIRVKGVFGDSSAHQDRCDDCQSRF